MNYTYIYVYHKPLIGESRFGCCLTKVRFVSGDPFTSQIWLESIFLYISTHGCLEPNTLMIGFIFSVTYFRV